MPLKSSLSPDRVDFDDSLVAGDIKALVSNADLRVIQCVAPVSDATWSRLNEEFFSRRPDVELRAYGFYSDPCDLSFIGRMTNLRNFAVDCHGDVTNLEAIATLTNPESLTLSIFSLSSFEVLSQVPPTLTKLSLGWTRSKKPDLAPLARFERLKVLFIEGHSKNIEAVSGLQTLEDVTLRSVTTPDLSYLKALSRMWSLDIKLGGIRSLQAVAGMPSIKHLELWQIRGLTDAGIISELPGLQNLFLQSLPQVSKMPRLGTSNCLRKITFMNMKGLADFSELEWAPALEDFILMDGAKQEPEQLVPVLRNPRVRGASAYFGSDKKNGRFEELRKQHGKAPATPLGVFDYR
jgi:hypothetical protein